MRDHRVSNRAVRIFMSTVVDAVHNGVQAHVFAPSAPIRIALLGVGQVGGALAGLLQEPALSRRFNLSSGLVRDLARPRPHATGVPLTATLSQALGQSPDVVVEVLGGLEPARTLILEAIERRIPVVTANKSLLAAHGDELLGAAATGGVPLRYEAAVLAGVPFLGTFANRSLARDVTGVCGIVNGTTNFILSEMFEHRTDFATALAEAKRRGYAEPNPANDVHGVDAVEKLCVLLRHFGDWSVAPASISVEGIDGLQMGDLTAAREFDGVLKPVVQANWHDDKLSAFTGPAFVPVSHLLAWIHGVQNAVLLRNRTAGDLFFAGPGAGPTVTAATVLDDVTEVAARGADVRAGGRARQLWKRASPDRPVTEWFVRLSGERLPDPTDIADLLASHGVWLRRTSESRRDGGEQIWLLTHRCSEPQIADALATLGSAVPCRTFRVRVLEG
jgi:homoserine dehydrogenase